MDRRLTDSSVAAYYDGFNESRDARLPDLLSKRQRMYEQDRKFVRIFLDAGRLLDIGCGRGDFLSGFVGPFDTTGYDIDSSALTQGRERYPGITLVGDESGIVARAPFDGIAFRGTLQYQRDLAETAALVTRVIKPGGCLFVLATPNAESPLALLQREDWVLHNKREHLYVFDLRTLAALFPEFDVQYYDFPYVGTPYEDHGNDLDRFQAVCRGERPRERFPFWGSIMNVVLKHKAP